MSTPPLNALVTKIRGAHPGAYDDMDDATLTKKVLAKYPQYSDLAAPSTTTAAGAPSSVKMKTGEGPIARNLTSFETQLSQMPKATVQLLLAKHWPIIDAKNKQELWEDIKSLNPVMRQYEGGPIDVGATAANLLPMLLDVRGGGITKSPAGELAAKGLKAAKELPKAPGEMARKGLTTLSGAGPERTTEPLVEEFKAASAKATQKQAVQEQRVTLTETINQGSKQFGEGVKELARKVKSEQIDPQYDAIRKATASDPGEPLAEIAKDARTAEGLIKGSTENIKQFRELLRKAPETEGVQTSAGFTVPGEPLYEQLVSEGAIDTGGKLPYSDLQGYSTELGDKLRKGGMPDDVYRAIKYLKEKIDTRKQAIADRNGVGPQLTKANADYTHYTDTFFEKPSAIAATLDRVGKLDPEHYAAPVISGKAAQLGILRLRHYAKDFPQATQLAEQAESLRKSDAQLKTLPKQRIVEQPKPPTLEDVKARKTKEVKSEAREIGRLNKWDAQLIAGSAIGPFFGRWETLLIDPAYLVARKGLGKFLDRPAVLKWLAEPSPQDIRILNSLPPEAKAEIAGKMTDFVVKERKPVPLGPSAKQFLGPVSLSVIAAAAMNKKQTPDTARDVMRDLKGKPPGQQKKELNEIIQRHSNPMMPVGPEAR